MTLGVVLDRGLYRRLGIRPRFNKMINDYFEILLLCEVLTTQHEPRSPILPRKSNPAGTKNEFTIAYIEKGRISRKISLDGKTAILI